MKKKLFAMLLMALLMITLTATAFAETIPGASGWYVEFNSKQKMESNFSSGDIADALSNVQPGDETTVTVTVRNTSGVTVDWYMLNNIIQTLEESNGAKNGGYTYILTYSPSSGSALELYNSNKVGGGGQAGYTNPTDDGLKEIEDALKDYMFLERMDSGNSGVVTLYVALDGESQDNSYQNAEADLQLRFAVEVVPTEDVVVQTGDVPVKLSPMYIGMGVSGLAVLLLAIDGAVRNVVRRKEPKH
ncbi:MAG: hypothetical protein IJK03_05825 [Oscillospiraceae bacterium]|nr:hypothetical protein [Oscillospiraceae bacterium]MBQ6428277.1 hypothetical protein [Oscillospiraceae bacterium]